MTDSTPTPPADAPAGDDWLTEAWAFRNWLVAHNGSHLTGAFCELCVMLAAKNGPDKALDYVRHMERTMRNGK